MRNTIPSFHGLRLTAMTIIMLLTMASCTLERSGTGSDVGGGGSPSAIVDTDVQPRYFCAGDPITLSWDFSRIGRQLSNCEYPTGGLPAVTTCRDDSECPDTHRCLDGGCCPDGVPAEECGAARPSGCLPDFSMEVTADSYTLTPPFAGRLYQDRGTRTETPSDSTAYTFDGTYTPPAGSAFTESYRTRLVQPLPGTPETLLFPFACTGGSGGYPRVEMHDGSENLAIASVRNTTAHSINVTNDLLDTVIPLAPGEATDFFNGQLKRANWLVSLSPSDPAAAIPTRCSPTGAVENPKPDLQIRLTLVCSPGP